MSESKKKGKKRGERYNAEEKGKIVAFVNEYNTANGRGGQSAAAAKFSISPITIASWLKGSGAKAKKSPKRSKGAKAPKAAKVAKASKGGSLQSKLSALNSLAKEIDKLEAELKAKLAKFNSLKTSL